MKLKLHIRENTRMNEQMFNETPVQMEKNIYN